MLQQIRRRTWLFATLLVLFSAPLIAGCYGRFPMTGAIYEINEDTSNNEVIDQLLFYILSPVYVVGIVIDVVFFNFLEFWTGDNTVIMTDNTQESPPLQLAVAQ